MYSIHTSMDDGRLDCRPQYFQPVFLHDATAIYALAISVVLGLIF